MAPRLTAAKVSSGRTTSLQTVSSLYKPASGDSPVPLPAALHVVAVHARRGLRDDESLPRSGLLAAVVHVLDVEGVDVARQEAEEGQADVDEQVCAEACDEEDADGWN